VTNHSPPTKRFQVYSVQPNGGPHECIGEYNTLDELRRHPQPTGATALLRLKPKLYVPLREYLALMRERFNRSPR
jgi:hypothetical protein